MADIGAVLQKAAMFENLPKLTDVMNSVLKSMVNGISDVISKLGEIEHSEPHQDPILNFEIEQLKQALRELSVLCKRVVSALKSLAKYATNEEILSTIYSELAADPPNTKTLSIMLNRVKTQFKRFSQRTDIFLEEYSKLLKDLEKTAEIKQQEKDALAKDNNLQEKIAGMTKAGSAVCLVSGTAASTICVATAGMGTPLALLIFGTVAGTAVTATVSANYYAAAHFSERYLQLLDSTAAAVKKVHEKANEVKNCTSEFDKFICGAQYAVEDLENDTSVDQDQLDTYIIPNLKHSLGELKENMKEILSKCNSIE